MRKHRLPVFLLIMVIFLLIWAVYVVLLLQATDSMYRVSLSDQMEQAEVQIESEIERRGADLTLRLNQYLGSPGADVESWMPQLEAFAAQEADLVLYGVGTDGRVYGQQGATEHWVEADLMRQARERGHAMGPVDGLDGIGTVMRLQGDKGLYVLWWEDYTVFFENVMRVVRLDVQAAALYDEQGTQVIWQSAAGAEADGAAATQLNRGVLEYRASGNPARIQARGVGFAHYAYLPLPYPKGWVWGGYIAPATALAAVSDVLWAGAIPTLLLVLAGTAFVVSNQTSRRKNQEEVLAAGQIDPLTKLANATGLDSAMRNFFSHTSMDLYSCVCVDVMAFHRFNTMFGYAKGDALLSALGEAIAAQYYCGARTSGDLFVFLADSGGGIETQVEKTLNQAVAEKMGRQFASMVTLKIGIYPVLDTSHTLREIYDGALLALRDAKKHPTRNTVVYGQELQEKADSDKRIEANMLRALSGGEFKMYLQPKFNPRTLECQGSEALVRWDSEELGFLFPDQFITLFEQNGFIVELDFFVLEQALLFLQRYYDAGLPMVAVSVNQSRVTLTFPNYLQRLRSLLARFEVPLRYLEVEMTESALENNQEQMLLLVQQIRAMGLSVSLDDFGSGYLSLNTLRELPVDVLKIDKGFIDESLTSPRSRAIIKSMIALGRDIDIDVVCEGVETPEQLAFLARSGCDLVQGYLFSKPIDIETFEKNYLSGQWDESEKYPQRDDDA